MVCREAKRKLTLLANGRLATDDENALREHLKGCSCCALLASAEQMLTLDIDQVRGMGPVHPMTIDQIRTEIAARERNIKNTNPGVRIMREINHSFHKRPRLSLAAITVFILLVSSALIPVGTEHQSGYEVAFAAPVSSLMLNQENAEKLLSALEIDDAGIEEISEADSVFEYKIAPLKDSVQVRKLITVLDSLGGRRVRVVLTPSESRERTIWQLLFKGNNEEMASSLPKSHTGKRAYSTTINLNKKFKDDFILWVPTGNRVDSLRGLLLNRQGDKTRIQVIGEYMNIAPDSCGWNLHLNNVKMQVDTSDGEKPTLYVSPQEVPMAGMGPKLGKIKPNPFSDKTIIEYMIPQAYEVKLQILDEQGQEICTLLNGTPPAGIHQVSWNGRDADGNQVRAGTYVCRFTAGDHMETREIRRM